MGSFDPVFGLTEHVPRMRDIEVRGDLCASRHRYVLEHVGKDGLARLAAALPPPARAMLEDPPRSPRWGSLGALMDLDRAIVDTIMGGDVRKMRAFGEEIGTYDVSRVYALVVKLAVTPRHLVRRLIPMYGSYFRGLVAELGEEGPGFGDIAVSSPLPFHLCEYGIPGFAFSALSLSSARHPKVEQTTCIHRGDPRCTWRLAWTV